MNFAAFCTSTRNTAFWTVRIKIKEYVARVKELGMTARDHRPRCMASLILQSSARAAGINPVPGCEVHVAPGSRFDKNSRRTR